MREVREEVGLDVAVTGLLGIWMDTYRASGAQTSVAATMNCYYHAKPLDDSDPVVDPAESTEAAWFAPGELPGELAFPEHAGQVLEAWRAAVASDRARTGGGASSP